MLDDLLDLDFKAVKTVDLNSRGSLVGRENLAKPLKKGQSFKDFCEKLPHVLASSDLKDAASRIAKAVKNERPVILAFGGHVVKVGLAPLIIDLMNKSIISALAANGSVMVHDCELALVGATSEDVKTAILDGSFGVTGPTGKLINRAAENFKVHGYGLGYSLGKELINLKPPYASDSLFVNAAILKKAFTIHVALGTDVYHIHPDMNGANMGAASIEDFHLFCRLVANLEGGVFINLGSAVIMPEVFLKALTLVRNLGHQVDDITTINMDFIKHYRPSVNVVSRPTQQGGKGFYFIGHHEIMFPLLMSMVLEELD